MLYILQCNGDYIWLSSVIIAVNKGEVVQLFVHVPFFSLKSICISLPRLSIPNMEDLKRRILKIVSNCNKPKVKTTQNTNICVWQSQAVMHIFFILASAIVPHPHSGFVVRVVWRGSKWPSNWNGQQAGGGAYSATVGRGVADHSPFFILSELGLGWLTCTHSCTFTTVLAWTCSLYYRRWAIPQVCTHNTQFTVNYW